MVATLLYVEVVGSRRARRACGKGVEMTCLRVFGALVGLVIMVSISIRIQRAVLVTTRSRRD